MTAEAPLAAAASARRCAVPTLGSGALTAAIWPNDRADQPIKRSLAAYDH